MSDFRRVNDQLLVSPQASTEAMTEAARLGVVLVINNRPDGEAPGQPTSAEIEAAAKATGMDYLHLPIAGMPPSPEAARRQVEAVSAAKGPVLAFCRSGTRSISSWALGQAASGATSRGDLIAQASAAGYDLTPLLA